MIVKDIHESSVCTIFLPVLLDVHKGDPTPAQNLQFAGKYFVPVQIVLIFASIKGDPPPPLFK